MTTDLAKAALEYTDHGWKVFPLAPGTKEPIRDKRYGLTSGYLDATDDPAKVAEWWERWPNANIGLALSSSGLVALDADLYKSECQWEDFVRDKPLPLTLTQQSARGGMHYLYTADPEAGYVGQPRGKAGGIEIKHKGYIALAPSVFAGGQYKWLHREARIEAAPDWLPTYTFTNSDATTDPIDTPTAERALAAIDPVALGYEEWTAVGMALYHGMGDDGFPLWDEWSAQDAGRYHSEKMQKKWQSFSRPGSGGRANIRTLVALATAQGADPVEVEFGIDSVLSGFEPVTAPPANPTPAEAAASRVEQLIASMTPMADLEFSTKSRYLVKGWLDKGAFSVLYGESNAGKTFAAVDLAFHVAAGAEWFGNKIKEAAPVYYIAAEGGIGITRRIEALRKERPELADRAARNLIVMRTGLDLCTAADAGYLIQALNAQPNTPALIIIDTLARAMGAGDENTSKDMGVFVQAVDALREETGAHVMVIHHSGKDTTKGARGSSSLRAAVDTEIEIVHESGVHTATIRKQRDMDVARPIHYRRRDVALGIDEDMDPIKSAVIEACAPPSEDEKTTLSPVAQLGLDTFQSAAMEYGNHNSEGDFIGLHIEPWREEFYRKHTGDNPSSKQRAFLRAREKLIELGTLMVLDDVYTPTDIFMMEELKKSPQWP